MARPERHARIRTEHRKVLRGHLDGRLLATDGKGIELYDVTSGKLVQRIPRILKRAENTIENLEFNPMATLLRVTANWDEIKDRIDNH
jgi:hypothetical protein